MRKLILLPLLVFCLSFLAGCNDDAELRKKANTYLDKQAQAEQAHKNMGKNDMNTDWMKNVETPKSKKKGADSKNREKEKAESDKSGKKE